MENYGFVLITRNEARRLGFPDATGMFNELYTMMEKEIERYPAKREEYGTAMKMTAGERRISFLNRYMIFKKVRNVNTTQVHHSYAQGEQLPFTIGKPVKLGRKIVLRK